MNVIDVAYGVLERDNAAVECFPEAGDVWVGVDVRFVDGPHVAHILQDMVQLRHGMFEALLNSIILLQVRVRLGDRTFPHFRGRRRCAFRGRLPLRLQGNRVEGYA